MLAASLFRNWDSGKWGNKPDLRAIILHPDPLTDGEMKELERAGWGLCHLPRLKRPERVSEVYKDTFNKLYVFNMTDYRQVVFIDSDTLVTGDLGKLLSVADRLVEPGSSLPGPRVAAVDDWGVKSLLLEPSWDRWSSGVFVFKPDKEEYLWLLNLMLLDKVWPAVDDFCARLDIWLRKRDWIGGCKYYGPKDGEQTWLNEVYSGERIPLGLVYNANTFLVERMNLTWAELEDDINIIHFAGAIKPWDPKGCPKHLKTICDTWNMYYYQWDK